MFEKNAELNLYLFIYCTQFFHIFHEIINDTGYIPLITPHISFNLRDNIMGRD